MGNESTLWRHDAQMVVVCLRKQACPSIHHDRFNAAYLMLLEGGIKSTSFIKRAENLRFRRSLYAAEGSLCIHIVAPDYLWVIYSALVHVHASVLQSAVTRTQTTRRMCIESARCFTVHLLHDYGRL